MFSGNLISLDISALTADFFVRTASAQAAGGAPAGPGLSGFILPLVFIGALYFLLIRPQAKRAKEHQALVQALAKGDEVVTAGGVLGRITGLGDQFVTLKIAQNTEIKIQRHNIGAVVPKGTMKD
ncbi:MAG: preprotein translocase subunit YajC [Gammaproteobacteria bacterium]